MSASHLASKLAPLGQALRGYALASSPERHHTKTSGRHGNGNSDDPPGNAAKQKEDTMPNSGTEQRAGNQQVTAFSKSNQFKGPNFKVPKDVAVGEDSICSSMTSAEENKPAEVTASESTAQQDELDPVLELQGEGAPAEIAPEGDLAPAASLSAKRKSQPTERIETPKKTRSERSLEQQQPNADGPGQNNAISLRPKRDVRANVRMAAYHMSTPESLPLDSQQRNNSAMSPQKVGPSRAEMIRQRLEEKGLKSLSAGELWNLPVRDLEVGQRVFSEFPANKLWYWGVIAKREKKKFSHFFTYDIDYDDGDHEREMSASKIRTIEEYEAMREKGCFPSESPSESTAASQANKEAEEERLRSYTPRELWLNRCKQCENCLKEECGKCNACLKNPKLGKVCCFQKMCLDIPTERKLQTAVGFPQEGWTFIFDNKTPRTGDLSVYGGLSLFAPKSDLKYGYSSAENAKKHYKKALSDFNPQSFYQHVGLAVASSGAGSQTKRPSGVAAANNCSKEDSASPLTLEELNEAKCTMCTMCTKQSCGKCQACMDNKLCFKKMCVGIQEGAKAQPTGCLPPGWTFYFTDPTKLTWYQNTAVKDRTHDEKNGLVLLPPPAAGKISTKFRSAEAAFKKLKGSFCAAQDLKKIEQKFYKYVGCLPEGVVEEDVRGTAEYNTNTLIGKRFCQKWTDVDGKTKVVYGVVEAWTFVGQRKVFTVRYNDASRNLINKSDGRIGGIVPGTHQFPESEAYGGCLSIDPNVENVYTSGEVPTKWVVPEMRHEDFEVLDGIRSPRLTVHIRGFELVFRVKQSTKPNAGKGVFVSCNSLTGEPQLVLQPGELIDMGVYAPFRRQDKKRDHVFLLKNFIHSLKCEEWTFGLRPGQSDFSFDITDDRTGNLHELAKRHIPAYVNETSSEVGEVASVLSYHDPEGCVHYLLGHEFDEDGPFSLATDGSEMEILINYGTGYEGVRIRKNYSRLPPDALKRRQLELANEALEYYTEFQTYNRKEIYDSLHFIYMICKPEEPLDRIATERALIAALILRSRANCILKETHFDTSDTNGDKEDGDAYVTIEQVYDRAEKLVNYLYGYWWNNPAELQKSLLSDETYKAALKGIFKDVEVTQLTPEEFLATVIKSADEHVV